MTPYYKSEWYDDTPITVGSIVQLPSMSFGIVIAIQYEDTEDMNGNLIGSDIEYVVSCLYTGRLSTISSRQNPEKFKTEYLHDILTTAPYHRWIYENYDEFYSKDPYWVDWFVCNASEFSMTIRGYVEKADEMLKLQNASWEREYPSEEWQRSFRSRLNEKST